MAVDEPDPKAARREAKQRKARHGMVVTNRSLKSVIEPLTRKVVRKK